MIHSYTWGTEIAIHSAYTSFYEKLPLECSFDRVLLFWTIFGDKFVKIVLPWL